MKKFIKMLFNPKNALAVKEMTMFISLLIFFVIYLGLQYPSYYSIGKMVDKEIKNGIYDVNKLESIVGDVTEINKNDYIIKNGTLTTSLTDDSTYKTYKFTYTKNDVIDNIYIVFDPFDVVRNNTQEIYDLYAKKYNIDDSSSNEDVERAAYTAYLIYKDKLKNKELDYVEAFLDYQDYTNEEIVNMFNATPYFVYYEVPYERSSTDKSNNYMYALGKQFLYFQRKVYNDEGVFDATKTTNMISYTTTEYKFKDLDSEELGKTIEVILTDYLKKVEEANSVIPNIFYMLLYPFLLVLIVFMFSRKDGELRKFKEYYNIAAISGIIPFLIALIISFITPNANFIFALLFSIYYIFFIAVINKKEKSGLF